MRNAPCKRERSKKLVTKRGKTAAGGRRDNLHKPQLEQADWTRLQSSWAGEHKHSQVLLEGSFNSAKGIDLSGMGQEACLSRTFPVWMRSSGSSVGAEEREMVTREPDLEVLGSL